MFEAVSSKVSFPALELEVMESWKRDQTFQASLRLREGRPRFVFYEGPPTANGRPGTHHILARAFKDLFGRYKTMKGFYVERKAGWDTHGLPVELEVEKELGITIKSHIEEFGIEEFNRLCRQNVFRYVEDWTVFSERMAFWQDYENAYWTLSPEYIQSVWWALKTMWERDLVYKGFRVAPYCPRCGTPLSSHELAQGYRDNVPDPSVHIRFRLRDEPETSILAWTTTPWTLPGNVALAVDENLQYVKVRQKGENLILAEARLGVLEGEYEIIDTFPGSELLDLRYEPLYPYSVPAQGEAHHVVSADFVSVDEGTGVVHTSALYGVDDLRLCQEKGIPFRHTVDLQGRFLPYVEKFAGVFFKDADRLIVEDLRGRGLLYRAETIEHTYPFCWRCGTPLLYYALDSWFVRTTARRDELLANNAATNWVPDHIKHGRMGDWLQNNVDWAISRSRYWGTPLPFWVCDSCGAQAAVGSAAELGLAPDADLHRPYIDAVTFECAECGGVMRRVPEVLDAWFDSGSMPFAQRGHPLQGKELFEETFPADFICEAVDQTRGWFYSLLAISTLLFGQNSYRNVICLGLVVDPKGQKASKSRGNVLDPNYLFETFGSDAVRWYFFTAASPGENYRTSPEVLQEVVRRDLLPLWNVYSFFVTYASLDGFAPGLRPRLPLTERPVLDRWLLSRLNATVAVVERSLEAYEVTDAARPIQALISDLSNWYVRRSRRRFWKSESDLDKLAAYQTLHETLVTLTRLLAPFTPFLSEAIHRNLTGESSVHLADFPEVESEALDSDLEVQMARARRAVEAGLAARDAARIRVRQPLRAAALAVEELPEEIAAIVREELNVKSLSFGAAETSLDTEISEELRLEGLSRELVRNLQERRRRAGLNIEDRIEVFYEAQGRPALAFDRFAGYIKAETLARKLVLGRPSDVEGDTLELEGESIWIGLRRSE
jgi:isoleucyl-tRNA synthetase